MPMAKRHAGRRTWVLAGLALIAVFLPRSSLAESGLEHSNLCAGYERFGRLEEALRHCTAAITSIWLVEPILGLQREILIAGEKMNGYWQASAHFERAYVLFKMSRFRDALADFNRSIALGMGSSAYYGRGLVWEKLGDRERAREDFAVVAKENADWSTARSKLLEYELLSGPCKYSRWLCW